VKNDHEGSAPRVIIRGVQIRRIQKHNVSFFGAGRPPCPNSRRHTPGGAVVADNSFADDEKNAFRPWLRYASMRRCSAVMTHRHVFLRRFGRPTTQICVVLLAAGGKPGSGLRRGGSGLT
jgi:hypothetical protein